MKDKTKERVKEIIDSCFDDIIDSMKGTHIGWQFEDMPKRLFPKSIKLYERRLTVIVTIYYYYIDLYRVFINTHKDDNTVNIAIVDCIHGQFDQVKRTWEITEQFTVNIEELEYTLTKYFLEKNGG